VNKTESDTNKQYQEKIVPKQTTQILVAPRTFFGALMTNVLSTTTALLLGSTMLVSSVHAGDDGMAELKKVMQSQIRSH